MRISWRDKRIIELLREGPATGQELAAATGVSRRTVLRDVARINAELDSCSAGVIEGGQSYRLLIRSQTALTDLLDHALDEAGEVILAMFCANARTVGDIAEAASLPPTTVSRALEAIATRHANVLELSLRPGRGVELRFRRLDPQDFLAALSAGDRALREEVRRLGEQALGGAEEVDRVVARNIPAFEPWVSSRQLRTQVCAALAAAPFVQDAPAALCRSRRALDDYLARKAQTRSWLEGHRYELIGLAADLLNCQGARGVSANLPSMIFEHVARSALFPTIMDGRFHEQVRSLRFDYPFELDFARTICARMEELKPDLLLEPELCALYVIGGVADCEGTQLRILLLSARRSLESVNRAILERSFGDVRVMTAGSVGEARRLVGEEDFDLLVRDEMLEGAGVDDLEWDCVCRGLLDDRDIASLRRSVLYVEYRHSLHRILPKESYVTVDPSGLTYEEVLATGLEELVGRGRISDKELAQVISHELRSERLQFNGVVVPHCVTDSTTRDFRMLAIAPKSTFDLGGEPVGLLLVVLASRSQPDKSTIFSYLYSVAGEGPRVRPGLSYRELVELLEGGAA